MPESCGVAHTKWMCPFPILFANPTSIAMPHFEVAPLVYLKGFFHADIRTSGRPRLRPSPTQSRLRPFRFSPITSSRPSCCSTLSTGPTAWKSGAGALLRPRPPFPLRCKVPWGTSWTASTNTRPCTHPADPPNRFAPPTGGFPADLSFHSAAHRRGHRTRKEFIIIAM